MASKTCGTCRWWAYPEQVCVNPNSANLSDFTLALETCRAWEKMVIVNEEGEIND